MLIFLSILSTVCVVEKKEFKGIVFLYMNPGGIFLTLLVTRQPSQILIGEGHYKAWFISHICDSVFLTTETMATMEKKTYVHKLWREASNTRGSDVTW